MIEAKAAFTQWRPVAGAIRLQGQKNRLYRVFIAPPRAQRRQNQALLRDIAAFAALVRHRLSEILSGPACAGLAGQQRLGRAELEARGASYPDEVLEKIPYNLDY